MLLPGQCAARVRRRCCELIVRYLGGDLSIIPEIIANRGLQEDLAVDAPEDPRRAFGEAVEAGQGVAAVVEQVLDRALPQAFEKMTDVVCSRLDARLDAMARRVRPYAPAEGASMKQPLTIPQYLTEQERRCPGFAAIRKRFQPSFSTLVSMLQHEAVRSSGRSSCGGKRAYTERDRPVLDHAFELSFAYREALAAGRNRPCVIDLLRAG